MSKISELIRRLRNSSVVVPKDVENAMKKVSIEDFTEFETEGFYNDRPVVFLETPKGGVKTISAPHMISTLLYNLELNEGQDVVVYGAKGGYVSALIAHIVGENGKVTVLDPSKDVIAHISNNLRGYPTVECIAITDQSELSLPELNRVLVTGQIDKLPEWLTEGLVDGGFAIAPIGSRDSQQLVKIEKQEDDLFETSLGSVIFGPVDIEDSVVETPSPEEMAELVEQVVELMSEIGVIKSEDRGKLYDLVAELRQLPDDLPPPEEMDDPSEHPMMKLMLENGEWFVHLWPIIQSMSQTRIASFGGSEENDESSSHSDFVP